MPWSQNRSFSVELAGAPGRIAQVHSAVADTVGMTVADVVAVDPPGQAAGSVPDHR